MRILRPAHRGTVSTGPPPPSVHDGTVDIVHSTEALAERLPRRLRPLATLAYNYRWSWAPGGRDLFRGIDPERWDICGENPLRLLQETSLRSLERAAAHDHVVGRAEALLDVLRGDAARRLAAVGRADRERPIAFLCAEFAIHRSLPIYAGGLGVLAGDMLKEASDQAMPMVGVGLLYRQGYFQQRVDSSGWQQEYWTPTDPDRLPAAIVTGPDGEPLTVALELRRRRVVLQIWRVDVGRVPLFLLDAGRAENDALDRWITARLYVADRAVRLAQYALLGIGAVRALRAMGMEPAVVHLNEGHAALAALELARVDTQAGRPFDEAIAAARERVVFTTHTPVAAGNEVYAPDEIVEVLGDYPYTVGVASGGFLGQGRITPDNQAEGFGMTPLGIRVSRVANAVSRRHGETARGMWQPVLEGLPSGGRTIAHVTNGVHLPTWMAAPMRGLLERHLGPEWRRRPADPAVWAGVDAIPDAELWAAREQMRREFLAEMRTRALASRLDRNEPREYVERVSRGFDPDVLTVGFARRMASYKRLHLLTYDPGRLAHLLEAPAQVVIAGKAHPDDDEGKRSLQRLFTATGNLHAVERMSFFDNYDLSLAGQMVAGCDLWINVPRPPLEASGTSGMKSALNGGLNVSVLDGWWSEAFDGSNGWSLGDGPVYDHALQDERDAAALYDSLEREIIPLFYDRDEDGIPHGWVRRIKASLTTIGPRFSATRMLDDYVGLAYSGSPAVDPP